MKPGDIVAIRGRGWLADHICQLTKSPVSHVGLVISATPPVVIEALKRVKTNHLDTTIQDCDKAYLFSWTGLSDGLRDEIVYKALRMSAESYGYFDLVSQMFDSVLHTRMFTRLNWWWLKRFPICSFLVAESYSGLIDFGVPEYSITPGDIYNFCHTNLEWTTEILK